MNFAWPPVVETKSTFAFEKDTLSPTSLLFRVLLHSPRLLACAAHSSSFSSQFSFIPYNKVSVFINNPIVDIVFDRFAVMRSAVISSAVL